MSPPAVDLPPIEYTGVSLSDIQWTRAMIERAKRRLNELEAIRDRQRNTFRDRYPLPGHNNSQIPPQEEEWK